MKIREIIIIIMLLMVGSSVAGEIAPMLADQMAKLDDQDIIKVLVVMQEQADVPKLDRQLHLNKSTLRVRHKTIVTSLRDVAKNSQNDILNALGAEKSGGGIAGFTPHWIINAIVVKGSVQAIRELALRPDVKIVEPDLVVEIIEPVTIKHVAIPQDKTDKGFIAPGLVTIGADRVWNELGIDGTGTLVANIDSGVDGSHPALAARWRGNTTGATSAWQDFALVGSPDFPKDVVGHGTHVMGTITGGTDFDLVGVASGAEWIASNAIASSGESADNPIIAGFEWITDPDGNPETHDDVPDVCQNSWGVNTQMGYPDCFSDWWSVIDNCEAAGVVVTFSAGNEGPAPGTLRSPGDRATSPTNCFTIGSTSINYPNTVSPFSSRGPSRCGGEFQIKPEVMAPGEDIISSVPGGYYSYMSGTSMAGPHVAGVVALMRQAAPNLDVTTIKEILMATAIDLGSTGEDNNYGHGIVDAYAAVTSVMNNAGTVVGVVTDQVTGLPLAGVSIHDTRGLGQVTTQESGNYQFTILSGPTTLEVSIWGYHSHTISLEIPHGGELVQNISLEALTSATLMGTVYGPENLPVEGVTISVLGTPVPSVLSDSEGHFAFMLPSGAAENYELLALSPDLAYELVYIGLPGAQTVDFHLPDQRMDGFESGGMATFSWQTSGSQLWSVTDTEAYEGTRSIQTGAIGDSEESELVLDFYANGGGDFSFRYKVDSEVAYDRLFFYLDGQEEGTWSGSVPWTQYSGSLTTGWHQLRWVYTKDSAVSVGSDRAWIDLVELPGTGVQAAASISLSTTELNHTITLGNPENTGFLVGNDGAFPLDFEILGATPDHSIPIWLEISPSSGSIYPGNEMPITLTLSSRSSGVHEAELVIISNDPDQPETPVTVTLTVEGVSPAGDLPLQLQLTEVVPNPFNPATDIKFSLPGDTRVELRIYDVAGRPVRTLVAQVLSAGQHSSRWDGKNESGQTMASGVYFARLQAATETRIKSMVLVR